ncbi:hypothetical protein Trydic_g1295 [Trypoxylus dichotomus]
MRVMVFSLKTQIEGNHVPIPPVPAQITHYSFTTIYTIFHAWLARKIKTKQPVNMANFKRTCRISQVGSSVNDKSHTFKKVGRKDFGRDKNSLTISIGTKIDQPRK